jgi:cardiolipin synthase (CMP-forming)
MEKQDFRLEKIFTIPNVLSVFRLVLAFAFWYQYTHAITPSGYMFAGIILIVSGITDFLDGRIARRFNMVSELGKILDPIADKVTQGMIMLCLIEKFPFAILEVSLFTIKQIYLSVAGIYIIKKSGKNLGARWFGKVNTALLYAVSILLILPIRISFEIGNTLILLSCVSIIATLVLYIKEYQKIIKSYQGS